jgi:hypothetical protein
VSDILVNEKLKLIIVSHEYDPKGEGISWSIAEHDNLGLISIWKFDYDALDKTSLVLSIPFQNKVTNLLLSTTHCITATDNGKLSFIPLDDIIKGSKEIDRLNVALFLGRIIELAWLIEDKYCLAIGDDNYLKIFDFEKKAIVNGGSLVKRLDKSVLTCMEINESKVYLGTNESIVLIYNVLEPDYNPKHMLTISLEVIKSPLLSLKIRNKYFSSINLSSLFVVSEKLITKLTIPSEEDAKSETVYRLFRQKKTGSKLPLITAIEYIKTKDNDIILAGCTVTFILSR